MVGIDNTGLITGATVVASQETPSYFGGDIAKNLMSLYLFFNQELLNISISHSRKKIMFIHNMLSQLRDAWTEAAASAGKTPAPAAYSRIDING